MEIYHYAVSFNDRIVRRSVVETVWRDSLGRAVDCMHLVRIATPREAMLYDNARQDYEYERDSAEQKG